MQPIKKNISKKKVVQKKAVVKKRASKRKHQEYGTSKLEERFAKNFLDRLGVKYIYQFKMGAIKRFLDFFIIDHNIAIEVDGDYYHSYNKLYEDMNPMQKHNFHVDRQKDRWCSMNGIKLIRIWEHDINKHPEKVMEMLKDEFSIKDKGKKK